MKKYLFALSLPFLIRPIMANDSVASTPGHDLILEKSQDIRMKSERLHITPGKVNVDYIFYNEGKDLIETIVAFPLPEFWGIYHGSVGGGEYQFRDFKISTAGKAITPKIRSVVKFNGQDISKDLAKINVPTDRFLDLKNIPPHTMAILKKNKWYSQDNMDGELGPAYTITNTMYWTQNFPKGIEIESHHDYTPELGGNSSCFPTLEWSLFEKSKDAICCKSCQLKAEYNRYILSTGSNWKHGIEDFELRIEGATLIAVEIDGKKDFDLGSYQYRKKNFKPSGEIHIEYLGTGLGPLLPKGVLFEKLIDGPANCRSAPQGKTLLSIPDKATVIILERKESWYRIEYQKKECWTHRKNIQFLPEAK